MNQPTEGRILLVGEGNFSFSASIIENGTISGPQLTASCIDTFSSVQQGHRSALANIEFLEKAGATVLFEVDATDLHNYPDLKFFEYERVIFNFPLADRHNIKRNRSLLSDFFSSVKNILTERGQVIITLCKGQGGTPADQPMRSWHDSWQIVSMAANAGFILTDVLPFDAKNFQRYESVGFRFQDKSFNTDNALTHVFEVAKAVSVTGISEDKRFIHQGSEDYVVPTYIRRKLERWSLLEKEGHPLCTISQYISKQLNAVHPHISVLSSNDPHIRQVLTGYKSSVSYETSVGHNDEAALEVRDVVNIDNVDYGEVDGEGDRTIPTVHAGGLMPFTRNHTNITKEMKNVQNLERASIDSEIAGSSLSVTTDYGEEAGQRGEQEIREEVKSKSVANDGEEPKQLFDMPEHGLAASLSVSMPVYVVHKRRKVSNVVGEYLPATAPNLKVGECDTHQSFTEEAQQQSESNQLYHLRNSLLENLPDLFNFMKAKSVKSVLMSGIVYCMCPILPYNLAVSHELIFLSKNEMVTSDNLVNHLCLALRAILGKEDTFKIKVNRCPNQFFLLEGGGRMVVASDISLEVDQRCSDLGKVFLWELENPCDRQTEGEAKAATKLNCYVGAVLYLDSIAFHALHLPDIRLLWTEDERFSAQFSKSCLSTAQKGVRDDTNPFADFAAFHPFSLYPVRFVHDMSFWENFNRLFEEPEFLEVVREVADDIVTRVSLVDKFESGEEGKVSRCYRLVFQSHDRALSYIASWKLQSIIRLKVAQALGVELR